MTITERTQRVGCSVTFKKHYTLRVCISLIFLPAFKKRNVKREVIKKNTIIPAAVKDNSSSIPLADPIYLNSENMKL
jgi:hypothetical protein